MMPPIAFEAARLIDPASGRDEIGDLLVENRQIAALGTDIDIPAAAQRVNAKGLVLCPGFIDMRCFALDGAAAAAGGVTTIALAPNLPQPVDTPAMVDYVLRMGRDDLFVRVRPLGAATKSLAGDEIAELGLMQAGGAAAFTDGRRAIADSTVMLRLLTYATAFDALIIQHAEDPGLVAGASATDSELATRLGLPAAPAFAESLIIARDLRLVEATGARYHVAQVTTAESVAMIRAAKKRGLPVSCGVTPAHFILNELAISDYRTFAKLSPPLRGEQDRRAVCEGIADGTIDVICSGHDPRTEEDKRLPFAQAEPGMVGHETLLPMALRLYHDGAMSLPRLIATLTSQPAALLGLPEARLAVGAPADLVLFDPDITWRFDASVLKSAAKNSPFDGMPMQGRVVRTLCDGYDSFVRE